MGRVLRCTVSVVLFVSAAWAVQPDRIIGSIDSSRTIVLKESVSPRAQAQFDRGPVDPGMKLDYITLQFALTEAQQAALNQLLAEQQDQNSTNYHRWLTPEQYGARFGMSSNDLAKVQQWLQSQGFTVVDVARGRNWIAFSGTVGQVQQAFRTEIHQFNVDGEAHYANTKEISLPANLGSTVIAIRGLHDFLWKSHLVQHRLAEGALPDYSTGGGGPNFLAPDDIATIYDVTPLYTAGYDGTGMNLVIVGQSDVASADITQFRSGFNLPAIKLTQVIASTCNDPGVRNGDQAESDLDLEWSSAVARNANIIFDKCDSAHGGVFTAFQDAINNKRGSVVSMSYGGCEPLNGKSNALGIQQLVQQANGQGMTFMSSSGDSGAAGCDQGHAPPATKGLEVNIPASVPETTGVGGSEFNEGSGTYWGTNGTNFGSALKYIPEEAWNDSNISNFASDGGGVSIYFTKPSWQIGVGVPNDSARDVPDVSITASANHDGYIFCTSDPSFGFSTPSCAGGIVAAVNNGSIVGGTSASSPVFAGMITVLNHYLVKNGIISSPGLGNINPKLYQLAASVPSGFHDITQGNNTQTCTPGTPTGYPPAQQCPQSGHFGYNAGVGYDQATGLGSVDAYNLITGWNTKGNTPSTTALSLSVSNITVGTASVLLTAKVSPTSGNGTPTGSVAFFSGTTQIGTANLSSGKATYTYKTNTLAVGTYAITANYSGDGIYAGSNSSPSSLNVQDFSIAMGSGTVTISAPGQSGNDTVTLTPLNNFNQTVSYVCSGLPSEATCTFTPSSTGASVAISTTAASGRLHRSPLQRGSEIFFAMLFPGLLGLVSAGARRRVRRGMRVGAFIMVLALVSIWVACGGGSSTTKNPGTPAGTSTVTVTASAGSAQRTAQFTLTIQ